MNIQQKCIIKKIGRQEYEQTWQAMKDFTNSRDEYTVDEFWLVEHESVFTQGQAGKPEHILQTSNIPIIKTDRGGQVTYHGPGQIVVYLLLDIKRKSINVKELVHIIEQSIIALLADYHIKGELKAGAPGVYVKDAKIAALGLRVRKGCTYHGLSLNVNMDTTPFKLINPCGYVGMAVTQLSELTDEKITEEKIQDKLIQKLKEGLDYL